MRSTLGLAWVQGDLPGRHQRSRLSASGKVPDGKHPPKPQSRRIDEMPVTYWSGGQEAEMEIGTSDRIRTCQRMLVHLLVSNCKQTWTRGKRQDRVQRTWTRGKGRTECKCAKRVFVRLFPSFIITSKEEWLLDYHSKRPGLKVLQQGIDDFIENHEAQAEKERKEREATAAAEGWTVVVHHNGRKKTVDSESGIPMGSVGLAAAEAKKAKKKAKESAVTFYRFQRREARRNEIMEL